MLVQYDSIESTRAWLHHLLIGLDHFFSVAVTTTMTQDIRSLPLQNVLDLFLHLIAGNLRR